jgi:uncharacterized membrane protein
MAYGEGESINAKGEVAGYETTADTPLTQPFVWAPKDGLTLLPLLPGYDGCWLLPGSTQALNDRGEVVGVCYALDSRGLISHTTAFKWTASTGMAPLDTPPGLSSEGDAVNNRGQVAGQVFELPSLPSEPVVWTRTSRVSRLPHGAPRGKYFAGINQPGSIVFGTFIDSTAERPYVITRRSGLNFLETLPGGTFADGADINGRGVIAGGADTGTGAIHAVLFMPCTCRSHGTQQPRGAASESRSDHEGAPIGERRQSLHSASPTPHR